MRIALLAMTEPAGAGQPFPRAFLRVAGATLAQHQLSLVLALDCQRLICLARGTSPELIALQHAAEDAGLQFSIATGPGQLSGLVTANDEIVDVSEDLFDKVIALNLKGPFRLSALIGERMAAGDGGRPASKVQPPGAQPPHISATSSPKRS